MGRVYFDDAGNPHGLPVGLESAKRYQTRTYIDTICPVCDQKVFYTKNQKCVQCSRDDATDLFGLAQGTMRFEPFPQDIAKKFGTETMTVHQTRHINLGPVGCRDVTFKYQEELEYTLALVGKPAPLTLADAKASGKALWVTCNPCGIKGHYGVKTLKNECYFCELERNQPRPRSDARKAGQTWYVPLEPCESCGQTAERNVQDNRCRGCAAAKVTARQKAMSEGKTYYTPTEPCPKCGQIAEKSVNNGVCKGCGPGNDARETDDSIMMKANPDMIVSRKDAIALKMKVYRHGRPCKKGHTGYRYVSTNSCIDCLRQKPEVTS